MPSPCVLCWLSVALLWLCGHSSVFAARCPRPCDCNDVTLVVVCNNTNLDMVPITLNPYVRQLYLTHSQVRKLIATLSFYNDLEYLDLSHNQLTQIETHGFDAQEKLHTLSLSYNFIADISNDTFFGLGSLKILELDHNLLTTLPSLVFGHLQSLEELQLAYNRISFIATSAFDGLTMLQTLHLRSNHLTTVPSVSFSPLIKLGTLDFGDNSLFSLKPNCFSALRSLQHLSIDGCQLKDPLDESAFEGLVSVRTLIISNNSLNVVPKALSAFERLEKLEIGNNAFDQLDAHAFKGLRFLRFVDVSNCSRLSAIRKYAFSANVDLERVHVVNNPRLTVLESGAFEGVFGLRWVFLQRNALSSLSEELLPWSELDSLDLRFNPFNCNCSLLWLRDLLATRNLSSEGAAIVATCDAPSSLNGRNVAELSADQLSCYFTDIRQQALVGIAAAIVVACVITLVIVAFKYRKRVTSALKDKWSDGALRRKEHQYEKTNDHNDYEDENNILHATAQQPMKMTPVTEL